MIQLYSDQPMKTEAVTSSLRMLSSRDSEIAGRLQEHETDRTRHVRYDGDDQHHIVVALHVEDYPAHPAIIRQTDLVHLAILATIG